MVLTLIFPINPRAANIQYKGKIGTRKRDAPKGPVNSAIYTIIREQNNINGEEKANL